MLRKDRIAIVISVAWAGYFYAVARDWASLDYHNKASDFTLLAIGPVVLYWTYRFIKAGK